ncbi:MAG: transposase [Alphaproteobacteria bacterium]|nr:transposase [Alphaproteobacteria bacterium]
MLTYDLLPSDEYSAAELLSSIRWPDGMVCPHCGNAKHSHLRSRPRVFVCTRCQRHQSVTAGTPLTRCRVPLCKVFRAAWLLTRRRSISARRLHLVLDVAYETAWSLCHRLRSGPVVDDVRLDAFVSMSELRLTRRPPYRRPWDGPPLRLTLMWDSVGRFVALPVTPSRTRCAAPWTSTATPRPRRSIASRRCRWRRFTATSSRTPIAPYRTAGCPCTQRRSRAGSGRGGAARTR